MKFIFNNQHNEKYIVKFHEVHLYYKNNNNNNNITDNNKINNDIYEEITSSDK